MEDLKKNKNTEKNSNVYNNIYIYKYILNLLNLPHVVAINTSHIIFDTYIYNSAVHHDIRYIDQPIFFLNTYLIQLMFSSEPLKMGNFFTVFIPN